MNYLHPKLVADLRVALDHDCSWNCEEVVGLFLGLPSVKRYLRQAATPYAELSEEEKESDRIEARKRLKLYRPGCAEPDHMGTIAAVKKAFEPGNEQGSNET